MSDVDTLADAVFVSVQRYVALRVAPIEQRCKELEAKVAALEDARRSETERRLAALEAGAAPALRSVGR
jgi:hypothetical protein